MEKLGFRLIPGEHPIVPVMLGDAKLAGAMAANLQGGLLTVAYLSFHAGELCVAWALYRACGVPRWISWLLVAHVVVAMVPARRAARLDVLAAIRS